MKCSQAKCFVLVYLFSNEMPLVHSMRLREVISFKNKSFISEEY